MLKPRKLWLHSIFFPYNGLWIIRKLHFPLPFTLSSNPSGLTWRQHIFPIIFRQTEDLGYDPPAGLTAWQVGILPWDRHWVVYSVPAIGQIIKSPSDLPSSTNKTRTLIGTFAWKVYLNLLLKYAMCHRSLTSLSICCIKARKEVETHWLVTNELWCPGSDCVTLRIFLVKR